MAFFKRKKSKQEKQVAESASVTEKSNIAGSVPKEEKKYYQPDGYYQFTTHAGTPFEHTVVTFEDRKKISYPSARGLYVGEILLLSYCKSGKYPYPKNGYPGFWWFEYGIRNVGKVLSSLESRGFIEMGSARQSADSLTVEILKGLLEKNGLPKNGKKTELVDRVKESVPEEDILKAGAEPKYHLTELGKEELNENAYIPYMHSCSGKTVENSENETEFNIWSVNRALGQKKDKSNWKDIVDFQRSKLEQAVKNNNEKIMEHMKTYDPEGYIELKVQDEQIAEVQRQEKIYSETGDIDSYILFWEDLWKQGGLKFEGSHWMFRLPDLYIKEKRYDDALQFVQMIKRERDNSYKNKADRYIDRIKKMKAKQKNN